MPRQDGTGPMGSGPRGRGLGPCGQGRGGRNRGGFNQGGFTGGQGGRGAGFGRGLGRRGGMAGEAGWMQAPPPRQSSAPAAQGDGPGMALQKGTVAVSSQGPGLDDLVDPRFGRAAGFVIVDPQTMDCTYLDNLAARDMGSGAGIQAAETVARSGARVVLTGRLGPKAVQTLDAAGIRAVQDLDGLTVREAVTRFRNGEGISADPAPR